MSFSKERIFVAIICICQSIHSQTVEVLGKINSKVDVENIHIINKTAQVFAITNSKGEFKIRVSLNDVLSFTSVQHQPRTMLIDRNIIEFKVIRLTLEEQINELNEVLIGKILTGNLFLDIKNVEGQTPINFYDVGIPGYIGKRATQSERRLNEATTGFGITPLMNALSGRTKTLKNQIKLEEKDELIQSIKGRLAKDFFASNAMEDHLKMDFFYFCADDENFIKSCKNETDFKILTFLRQKYQQYMENLKQTTP